MGLHTGLVVHGVDLVVPLVATAALVAGFALAPLVVTLLTPTRAPGPGLRERLEAADGAPDPGQVRVVTGERGEAVDAFAVGVLPGTEYVFVTEGLLAAFGPQETTAVLTHEAGHLRLGHLRRRCEVGGVAGILWAGVVPVLGPLAATAGVAACILIVVVGLGVRQEYEADRYAADRTGRDATLRALELLERATRQSHMPAPLDRLSARAWLRRRIARLQAGE